MTYFPFTAWLIWKGWIWPSHASFMHSRNLGMLELLSIAFVTLLAYFKCPKTNAPPVCVPLPEAWTALTLLTVSSFLVATFTNITIGRWWSTRLHVNAIGGRTKNIAMLVAASTARAGPDIAELRILLARLLNLAHAIVFRMSQGPLTAEVLEERGEGGQRGNTIEAEIELARPRGEKEAVGGRGGRDRMGDSKR
jgi:hypothetical protein